MKRGLLFVFSLALFASCSKDDEVISSDQQLINDINAIDDYLIQNGITAIEHESGLRYVIHTEGEGINPGNLSDITVKYTGKLLKDESVFDSGEEVTFRLSSFLLGWQFGVPFINVGGKITLYIPSGLGYGPEGATNNGPSGVGELVSGNANLIVEIELLASECDQSLNLRGISATQLEIDVAAIDEYIANNNIDAIALESGIRYSLSNEGTGNYPTLCHAIGLNYSGKVIGGATVFDSGQDVIFYLSQLIPGWQIALQEVSVGSSVTLYIPSVYGYGSQGTGSIPADANLEFEIDLLETL